MEEKILEELKKDQENVKTLEELNELKVKYLGKKGLITLLNQEIRNIPNEEKKQFGIMVNSLREKFN